MPPLTRLQKRQQSRTDTTRNHELFEPAPNSIETTARRGKIRPGTTTNSTLQSPRYTRSLTGQKRKALKVCTGNTKKTRTLQAAKTPNEDETPVAQTTAAVTPGTITSKRQIRFPSPSQDPCLPDGVVNIFSNSVHNKIDSGDFFPRSFDERMRTNYRSHITTYGLEFSEYAKEQENKEILDTKQSKQTSAKGVLPFQPLLTFKMRYTLVSWLSEVTQEYKLSDATYHLAVTILDAVLATGPTHAEYIRDSHLYDASGSYVSDDEEDFPERKLLISRTDFQAYGCACIWIASKIEDRAPPRGEQLCYISDYAFSTHKLIEFETTICKLLEFRLSRTTPIHFLGVFERASHMSSTPMHPYSARFESLILYLLQLARGSFELSHEPPSLLCAAAVYQARAIMGMKVGELFWTPTLTFYTGYEVKDIEHVVFALYKIQLAAEEDDNSIYKQFGSEARSRVSLLHLPRLEDLTDLDLRKLSDVNDDEEFVYDYEAMVEELLE